MSARRATGSAASRAAFDVADIVTAARTHVGRVRSVNQDAYGAWRDARRPAQLLFVADGMGGHRGGEVASRLAVEQVGLAFDEAMRQAGESKSDLSGAPRDWLARAFERANHAIFEKASDDFELAGMGTTGVALLLTGESRAWVAHVGDSRAYRVRDGALDMLTGDHSVVGELVRRGQLTPEQARVHPQSNEILRALGTQPDVEVEVNEIEVRPGDRFLLCSDGLSGMLSDDAIAAALAAVSAGGSAALSADGSAALSAGAGTVVSADGRAMSADEVAARLIELANAAGGTDNITVQIADIVGRDGSEEVDPEAETFPPDRPRGGKSARPGAAPAAAGTWLRWAVALALVGALLLLLLGGGESTG